jgi:hypothetical protein
VFGEIPVDEMITIGDQVCPTLSKGCDLLGDFLSRCFTAVDFTDDNDNDLAV